LSQRFRKQLSSLTPTISEGDVTMKDSPTSKNSIPTEDLIRIRAYEIYQRRGQQEGHEVDDWLAAEVEVLATDIPKAA
jgi:hypothetical protein